MVDCDKILSALVRENYSIEVLCQALLFTGSAQQKLFALAQETRHMHFPENRAQVRSVIEVSNICRQRCRYCAIGGKNQAMNYSLNSEQIVMLVEFLYKQGRRTVLLQSGENVNEEFIQNIECAVTEICHIHNDIRIILCLGNLSYEQYERLYNAGAKDYILKFETSNAELFSYCKPNDTFEQRIECIKSLCKIGYNVGSGNIVGLPGQTLEDLANDLRLVHELPLAMNSTTIFIPAENSDFADMPAGNPNYTLNMMALMRIMNPHRLMPTTSSLEKMIEDGQFLGLLAGANTVTVHDGTPEEFQSHFPIYSAKRIRPQTEHFHDILSRAGMRTDNII